MLLPLFLYGDRNEHQNSYSTTGQLRLDHVPFGSYVCQSGSSTHVLGDELGIKLGLDDGTDDGMEDGWLLKILLGWELGDPLGMEDGP